MQIAATVVLLALFVLGCGGQVTATTLPPPTGAAPLDLPPPGDDARALVPDDAAGDDDAGTLDAGAAALAPDGACDASVGPGDLRIVELLIESVSGAGDYGEWVEVESTRDCAVDLRGLQGECAPGARVASFEVGDELWLPPHGTFVVADSDSAALDHDLPGLVLSWHDHHGDVLRNKGATVTLRAADAVVDSITYPALALTVGASLAFPPDCDPALRWDFARWQTSESSWFPGFRGTPNAPNDDVHCPR